MANYILDENAPSPYDSEKYFQEASERYATLIEENHNEPVYQVFFERNPAFMPGVHELIGASSFAPLHNALISQPRLVSDIMTKVPDFMWIARDSLSLCPVIIEIEKPSKAEFRKQSDVGLQLFNQALGQIIHWKALLSTDSGKQYFYDNFGIPDEWRKLKFTPQYLLVYGRRQEYAGNEALSRIRKEYENSDIRIASFDRLAIPDKNVLDCFTCKVKQGKYIVQHIPPTFVFKPNTIAYINGYEGIQGFEEAVKRMEYTSEDRKAFLLSRFEYWKEYGKNGNYGIIYSSDAE